MNVTGGHAPVRILVLIGTRPEAIKLLPVVLALREAASFEPVVVTTGQHRDLVDPILELGAIVPDVDLGVGRPGLSLNDLIATVVTRLDAFCRERFGAAGRDIATRSEIRDEGFPAAALVHGDTSSALAAAIAAFNLRIPVIHVEAGLRTQLTLTPFPEELNRQLIARIASFHLAPTTANEENLIQENVPHEQVFVTGNTGIDTLRFAAGLDVEFEDPRVAAAVAGEAPLVTVTAHRRENWHGGLASIGRAIAELASRYRDIEFVVPLHPNPIVRDELGAPLDGHGNVIPCEPLSYAPFARLLARSILVITDSGGIQEEAPALDVPVLVTRDTTERGEGVEAGTLRLVGTDPARIVEEASLLLSDPGERSLMATSENPYGDGLASERILAALQWLAGVGPPPIRFGPGFSRKAVLSAAGYRGGLFGSVVGEVRGVQPDRFDEHDRWVAG